MYVTLVVKNTTCDNIHTTRFDEDTSGYRRSCIIWLSYLVWWFVAYGELLGGLGLIIGGLLWKTPPTMEQIFGTNLIEPWGEAITRFSGIVLCCIMTGVIWIGEPESFMDVLLYDNLHVLLWVCALFFALRGNNAK